MTTLKFLFGLLVLAIAFGDLAVGLVAVVLLWRNRWRSSMFPYVGNLMLCTVFAIVGIYVGVQHLPQNTSEITFRPLAFRIWLLVSLVLAGLGIWPLALKLLLVTRTKRKEAEHGP